MSDDNLRKAITTARACSQGATFMGGKWLNILADAAETTLPPTKIVWRVSFVEDGETRTWCDQDTRLEACNSGENALLSGRQCVSIKMHEVPA